jgi:cellulose synthase/poly-beta-1,6-N-acetylglucosamine synthase-like glycosyltransferase
MTSALIALLVMLVFINRYVFGAWLQRAQGARFDERRDDFEPSVAIVIPMFNEGSRIAHTIESLLQLEYPKDKLSIIVVDDCSTDGSYRHARDAAASRPQVTVLRNAHNIGKRLSINRAVRRSNAEIIVSVDSDVIVNRDVIRQLVARFVRPEIAAVGGRVHILNANDNWLTKVQTIKYFFGYEYLKNLERACRSVMCLSGCLTAYRRAALVELEPILENRNILGVPIKYGEDRFLTRQLIKAGWQTVCTLDAVCYTIAPTTLTAYFSQQLRWRRSNLVDYLGGFSHGWRLHPLVAIHYFSMFGTLLAYPVLMAESLLSGSFWSLNVHGLGMLAAFGAVYAWETRGYAPNTRVQPLWFLGMAVLMPVTYLVLTPLALFTLDSSNWETRGAAAAVPGDEAEEATTLAVAEETT